MSNTEQFLAEVLFETKQLRTGIREGIGAIQGFEKASESSFERFATIAEKQFQRFNDSINELSIENVKNRLGELASKGEAALGTFVSSASKVQQYRLTLEALTGSAAAAAKELNQLQNYAAKTPFQLQDVVQAGVTLKSFKVDVQRFLPLAGDLASVFNRDLKDSAKALGKALSGSLDGLQILNDSFGITKRELKDAGASMKSGGAIALDSAKDIGALADAIERVASQKNFTGAMNKQLESFAGTTSQLEDAAFGLASAIGDSLIPTLVPLVQIATNATNALAQASPIFLKVVGGATALATAIAATGVSVLTFRTAMAGITPLLSGLPAALGGTEAGATAMGGAFTGALGPIGALAAAVGGFLLLGLNASERASIEMSHALEEQSRILSRTFTGFRTYRDAIKAATGSSEDFIKVGENTEEVLKKVKTALDGVSADKFVNELAKLGISSDTVGKDLEQTRKDVAELIKARADLREAAKILATPIDTKSGGGGALGNITTDGARLGEYAKTVEKEFGTTEGVLNRIAPRIEEINKLIAQNQTNIGIQKEVKGDLQDVERVYDLVTSLSKKTQGELKIKADTTDLKRSNALLEETTGRIIQLKGIINGLKSPKIDLSSVEKIQDALSQTSEKNVKQREALQGLLDLIKERGKLEKQSAQISQEASRKRVDSLLDEAQAESSAEKRLATLRKAADQEKLTADQSKRLSKEIAREEKSLSDQRKQTFRENVQQAVFEAQAVEGGAQKKIDALKNVLASYKLEGSQRRQVLNEISQAERSLAAEREQRRKAEAEGYKSEVYRQQELIISAIDDRIEKLKQEAAEGKAVSAELVQALRERAQKEIELIQARTDERKKEAKSSDVAAEVEKTGQLEIEDARRKVEKAIDDQKKAQKDRVKLLQDEKKASLDVSKADKARLEQASASPATPSSSTTTPSGGSVQNAPGQSLQDLAGELSRTFGRGAAVLRGLQPDQPRTTFAQANPQIAERLQAEDAARQERIAKQNEALQKAIADKAEARQKEVAARMKETKDAIDQWRKVDAARREANGVPGTTMSPQDAYGKFKKIETQVNYDQAQKKLTPPDTTQEQTITGKIQEFDNKQKAQAAKEATASKTPQETNIHIVVEVDDKGNKTIKSVKQDKATGVDGTRTSVDRALNGLNIKVRK